MKTLLFRNSAEACARAFALVGAIVLSAGCSSKLHPSGSAAEPESVELVDECKQYENALTTCFHREVTLASHESLVPKSKADRERVRALCANNLKRIQAACR